MTINNSSSGSSYNKHVPGFLSGGGEMGRIIENFDWSSNPLGPANLWPPSLRIPLSIILKSKLPMVLLWGDDYRFFYNDAYRPTLGNDNKHPHVLGTPASGIWVDSWGAVKELIDKVYYEGESVLLKDLLIPIYRNGKNEDVYWTFNYSPVTDESDAIAGVFITCFETTENVVQLESFLENTRNLNMAMEIAELGLFKVDLKTQTAVYSKQIMEFLGLEKQNMPLGEIFDKIHPEDRIFVKEVIDKSIAGADGGKHDVVYRIINNKSFDVRYFRSIGQVVYTENAPDYISGIIQDVTQQVTSKQILEEQEKSFRNLVMQAPVAMAVFRGPDFVADIVNNAYLPLVAKTREEFVGKPLFESLPETRELLEPLARDLVNTGKSFPASEFQITINRNGKAEVCWFNSVWEPYFNYEGKIDGFMAVAHEVTEQVNSRKRIEESEARFRSLLATAPVAIGLFVGRDLIIENPNQPFIDILGKGDTITGKPLREAMPELIIENQPYLDILDEVYTSGKMFQTFGSLVKIVQNGVLRHNYYDFTYTPLRDAEGKVYAILDIAVDVTKQVHDRKRIEESEERYRTLIEEASVATALYMGRELQIRYANDILLNYWGKDKSVLGKPLVEAVPELEDQPFVKYLEKVFTTGETYEGVEEPAEFIINGKLQTSYFSFTYKALRDQDGQIYGIHHIALDVTNEVITKKALKESKERFQSAVEAIDGILWTNNAKGEMEGEQPGWEAITGQTFEEYQGYGWAKAVHPDDAQATVNAWNEALKSQKTFIFEHRVLLKDGSWGNFSIRAIPSFNEDGTIREWVGVHTNITEQKSAELALKESEALFRSLADQSPMFVYIVEPDALATMSYFNKTWLDYTGQHFEEAVGNAWNNIVHPDDIQVVFEIYTSAFQNRESYTIPAIRLKRHDGVYRWHLFKGNPRFLSNGTFIGYVGVGIDIHEQKLALDQLELNNEQLIRINNDLDNFIYTASHDLKAPMSNIEGLLNALRSSFNKKSYSLNNESEKLLSMMDQSINRFKSTIFDLTQISKAQRELDENVNEVQLDEIIEDVMLSIQDKIIESNAQIKIDLSQVNSIKFSKKNIKSIVYNLLSNSIKYRDLERIPEIIINTEKGDRYNILSVTDNGLGLSRNNIDKVFSMFKRFHDHVEGSGIGLYIVKRIIDNAGGKIEVESEPGIGTTFKIYFLKKN